MTIEITLSFKFLRDIPEEHEMHRIGNIADSIWPSNLGLIRGSVSDDRYFATMEFFPDRKMRTKEKKTLLQKLKSLDSYLDAQLVN